MKIDRRNLLKTAGMGIVSAGWLGQESEAVESVSAPKSQMKLGTVTYNIAKDWDLETIIKNCEKTRFEGVELRTTHAHKVEVDLTKAQREEVKKRFENTSVKLVGLGSSFDFHTPDQQKLRRDIEAAKEYMNLAKDVGAPGVKVRPNGFPKEVPQEKTLEQIGKSLRELGEYGQNIGVQIRLEVHGSETCQLPYIKTIMDVADHPNVGVCWNCNAQDLEDAGFDANFDMVKNKIFTVHINELSNDRYPYRKLFAKLNALGYSGFCLAETSGMKDEGDTLRFMGYYRALWLAYQDLL